MNYLYHKFIVYVDSCSAIYTQHIETDYLGFFCSRHFTIIIITAKALMN